MTISATDKTYTNIFGEATVTIYEDVGFSNMPDGYDNEDSNTWPVVQSGDSYDFGNARGGEGPYTWSVDGPIPIDPFEAESFEFLPETTGPFAGAYKVMVCDTNDWCREVMVKVPLVFEPYSKNIMGGESFDQVLKGADPGAQISEGVFLDESSNEIPEEEMDGYADVAPELPIIFEANSTATSTVTGADVAGLKVFKTEVVVTGDSDLTEENGLNIATTGWIRVMPVVTFSGIVQDALDETAIEGATILFKLGEVIKAETTSAADGTFSVDLLSREMTGAEYDVLVFAPNYLGAITTTAGWVNPETIGLTLETASITGTVTDSGSGLPIEGAKVESTVEVDDTPTHIVAYSDALGSYTLSLPVAGLASLMARASKVGYAAETLDVFVGPDFTLDPLVPNVDDIVEDVPEDGGVIQVDSVTVEIPPDSLAGPSQVTCVPDIELGEESPYTENSTVLVEISIDPVPVGPVNVTMPFNTTFVDPGDFKNGNVRIYYAGDADALRSGDGTAVPTSDIIYEDHLNGLVSFSVVPGSVFGAGAPAGGPPPVAGGGGGGGGCFIDTVTGGWASSLILLLGVLLSTLVVCSLLARRRM